LEKKTVEVRGAGARLWIARQFTRVEDVVYIGLGVLLAGCAAALLVAATADFVTNLLAGTLPGRVVELLDRMLLVLMVVEILYTVQVSFRGQTLVPEPFLIIGLIAGIRRVLILTAEFKDLLQKGDTAFRNGMIELGLLSLLIVALVISIVLLRKRDLAAERA
jgi:phosphate-starvation-inducible protein E